jgi:hypothetical protein
MFCVELIPARKECESCGNARFRERNVRYYPTRKHSPLKERNEQGCYCDILGFLGGVAYAKQ